MTITFPPQVIGDDTIQAYLTVETSGTPSTPNNVIMEDYGQIEWGYDPDGRWLVPGILTCRIKDLDEDLSDIIFSSYFTGGTQLIKMEVYINSSSDFLGYAQEDSIQYDGETRTLIISFAPQVEKLNETPCRDESGNITNPFGYTLTSYYPITTILTDLYQRINTAVTYASGKLEIDQDWVFKGQYYSADNQDFEFTDLYVYPAYIYGGSATHSAQTGGDILRNLALEFGCFAGMVKHDRGFFKQLYYYDSGNTQTVTVLRHSKRYQYQKIKYASFTDPSSNNYTAGTFTNQQGRFIEEDGMLCWFYATGTTEPFGAPSGSNCIAIYNSQNYDILKVVDTDVSSTPKDFGQAVADWWYYWRGDLSRTRADNFLLHGVDYDFLKCFNYGGNKYQIFNMKKNLNLGTTEVDAFYLGAL